MDYIRKACNTLFINNGKPSPFPNSDALIYSSLCEPNSIKCILRVRATCKTFPKIDELAITSLKCSKSCIKENKDCTNHTVKVNQFERVTYMHKGKEKKKLKLVDMKIHDFSENYTCLLPEEIQSLHWTRETATLCPIVVLRKLGEDIREDHLVVKTT